MGYTHYWRKGEQANRANRSYGDALEHAGRIVREQTVCRIAFEYDEPESKPETGDGIRFNGIGDDEGHETFWLPGCTQELSDFEFCKTARKPYDTVVTAVLAVIDRFAPNALVISSDGDDEDWAAGCALASEILGADVPVPQGVRNDW